MSASRTAARRVAKAIPKDAYRGYMPPDLPQHRPPSRIKPWWKVVGRPRLTMYPKPEVEEYSEEPEYPPLNDASDRGLRSQVRYDWYESLKSLPTAEQKLYEIDRQAVQRMAHINNWLPTCRSLQFAQYLTQTHVVNSLPGSYEAEIQNTDGRVTVEGEPSSRGSQDGDTVNDLLKQIVLEQLVVENETKKNERHIFISKSIRDGNCEAHVSNRLIQNIFTQAKKLLVCETNSQLSDYQIDLSPAIRSWWYHSGFHPPNNKVFHRSRKDDNGNVNTFFQMDGSSALNLRSDLLIEPPLQMDDPLVTNTSLVPVVNNTPAYYGAIYKFKWPVTLPGFWFEDEPRFDCPHTCFLSTDCLKLRQKQPANLASPLDDQEDCLTSQAVLTAFGWLNSLSMYHGYTPFDEIDYPLTCQVITTDGQNWMFNVFQLNSHTFHRDLGGPKRNNICWSSGLMKLYDDYSEGNFQNVNVNVIKVLKKFLSVQPNPSYTEQQNLRPLLGTDSRTSEEKSEMRQELRRMFEGRTDKWLANDWNVPDFEHIFFRSKEMRYQIRHMKPKWHIPKPPYPKIFE